MYYYYRPFNYFLSENLNHVFVFGFTKFLRADVSVSPEFHRDNRSTYPPLLARL